MFMFCLYLHGHDNPIKREINIAKNIDYSNFIVVTPNYVTSEERLDRIL